jgi:hypothetical protein
MPSSDAGFRLSMVTHGVGLGVATPQNQAARVVHTVPQQPPQNH